MKNKRQIVAASTNRNLLMTKDKATMSCKVTRESGLVVRPKEARGNFGREFDRFEETPDTKQPVHNLKNSCTLPAHGLESRKQGKDSQELLKTNGKPGWKARDQRPATKPLHIL
jgi:hypothetical protein